jgi:phage terminase small subunit
MGRLRKSINDKINEGEVRTERLKIAKRHKITGEPPVKLSKQEREVFDEVVEHLNVAGAGMDIDLRMICAYAKEVFILDDLQEQMKEAIASKTDEGAQAVKRLNTALSGCNQRIFQAQQSLGIGSLNRRKLAAFQDDLASLQDEAASKDPLGQLLKMA